MTLSSASGTRTEPFTVAGVPPNRVERPDSAQAVADLLQAASVDDDGVYPVGAGLQQRVGLAPERVDVALSTAGLAGIVRYDPEDLVVSVGAGTPLADLQSALAEHGQWLPIDAVGGDDATIGGLLALNLPSPRQLGSLSMRDLLLGMRVAQTDGTVASSGGMVVKNVSGLDMGRLHVGARGTLGVIASANFKVLPRPETGATLLVGYGDGPDALDAALDGFTALRASPLRPVAAELIVTADGVEGAVRFEGRAASVRRQLATAAGLLGGDQSAIDDHAGSTAWWASYVAGLTLADPGPVVLRADSRSRDTFGVLRALTIVLDEQGVASWRLSASPGLGIVWVRLPTVVEAALGPIADAIRSAGGVASAIGAVLPPQPAQPARDIDRTLREQFDPVGILNRGRFPL